ncbi:MAG: pyridoxal-phosphate dependent enzyme [Rhizobiales bacterium]|nr:pyridoxal-phosphate dependent enzyme [Hyphomicrobiales bacterium]
MTPTFADIETAAHRLAGFAVRTPVLTSAELDERVGGRVLLKCETLQRTGSFKFRGAYNAVASLSAEEMTVSGSAAHGTNLRETLFSWLARNADCALGMPHL